MAWHLGFLIVLPVVALTPAIAFESVSAPPTALVETISTRSCGVDGNIVSRDQAIACNSVPAGRILTPINSTDNPFITDHTAAASAEPDIADFVTSAGATEESALGGMLQDFGSPALSLLALTFISIAAFARRTVGSPPAGEDS